MRDVFKSVDFPQNQWLALPRELWLKVYEYFFLDLEVCHKIYFNLVCKFFDQCTRDPNFIKALINRYFPYLTDSPDFDKNPQIFLPFLRECLALNISVKDPQQYFASYLITQGIRRKDLSTLQLDLKTELPIIYCKRTQDEKLNENLKNQANNSEPNIPRLLSLRECTQREISIWNLLEENALSFIQSTVLCFNNFRTLVAFFHPDQFSPQGLGGLKRASAISDLDLLRSLMQQKEEAFQKARRNHEPFDEAENPNTNETLIAIKQLLANNDIANIRRTLQTEQLDTEDVKNFVNNPVLCKRVATWQFDDIFQQMTVVTFKALQRLAGEGGFQDAMVPQLLKNNRADLLSLLSASTLPMFNTLIGETFIRAHENWRNEFSINPKSEATHRWHDTVSVMLFNCTLRKALLRSPAVFLWFLTLNKRNLIDFFIIDFAQNLTFSSGAEHKHAQYLSALLKWAYEHDNRMVLRALIYHSHGNLIDIIVTETPKIFHSSFMTEVDNMASDHDAAQVDPMLVKIKRVQYKAAMLVKAANSDDTATIDAILAPYSQAKQARDRQSDTSLYSTEIEEPQKEAAKIAAELSAACSKHEKARWVFLKIAKMANFSSIATDVTYSPPFYSIAEWADPNYLEEFIHSHCNIAVHPSICWSNFFNKIKQKNIPALNEAIRQRLVFTLLDDFSCYALSMIKNDLSSLYRLIVEDPILLDRINQNPEWLLPSFRHFDLIVDFFWPRLSLPAKKKLLSIRPDENGNNILSLFNELDRKYPEAKLNKDWAHGVAYLLREEASLASETTAAPVLNAFPLRNSAEIPDKEEELKTGEKREVEDDEPSDESTKRRKVRNGNDG